MKEFSNGITFKTPDADFKLTVDTTEKDTSKKRVKISKEITNHAYIKQLCKSLVAKKSDILPNSAIKIHYVNGSNVNKDSLHYPEIPNLGVSKKDALKICKTAKKIEKITLIRYYFNKKNPKVDDYK